MTDEPEDTEDEDTEKTTVLDIVNVVSHRMVAIAAIAGAVTLLVTGHDGWGWLILLAFMVAT